MTCLKEPTNACTIRSRPWLNAMRSSPLRERLGLSGAMRTISTPRQSKCLTALRPSTVIQTEPPRSHAVSGCCIKYIQRILGGWSRFASKPSGRKKSEYNVDYRIVVPDRGVRWIEGRAFVAYDSNGQPRRVVGFNIDVTERKQAAEALRRREAELAEAQRLAHIGNWYWDAEVKAIVGSDELIGIFSLDATTPHPRLSRTAWPHLSRFGLGAVECVRAEDDRDGCWVRTGVAGVPQRGADLGRGAC